MEASSSRAAAIWRRGFSLALPGAFAALLQSSALAQNAPTTQVAPPSPCTVAGIVTSARGPLPGVVVSLADTASQTIDITSSAPDGTYTLRAPSAGQYVVKGELVAFAPFGGDGA